MKGYMYMHATSDEDEYTLANVICHTQRCHLGTIPNFLNFTVAALTR